MTRERPILFSAPMVRAILDGRKTQTRRVLKPQPRDHDWSMLSGYQQRVKVMPNAMRKASGAPTTFVRVSHHIPQNPDEDGLQWIGCPYGQPGDRLWVRETWEDVHPIQVAEGRYSQKGRAGIPGPPPVNYRTIYRADGEYPPIYCLGGEPWPYRSLEPFERDGIAAFVETPMWTPSIHMPRWASRITLEVVSVRVERLQDISGKDAVAEGIDMDFHDSWHPTNQIGAYQRLWKSINGADSWDANPWVWVVEFKRVEP